MKETAEAYALAGATKTRRPAGELFPLAVLAGAIIAVASAAANTAACGIPEPWTARTVSALLFPFGLGMVVVTGAELFTGDTLIFISVLDRRCTLPAMFRTWGIVWLGNLAGALLVAVGGVLSRQLEFGTVAEYTIRAAAAKCSMPFGSALVSGFSCNVLVTLAVLMALTGKDTVSRLAGAYLPVCLFVLCGYEHSVADMYCVGAGLLAARVYGTTAGLDISALTLSGFLLQNLLPVTLGNIAGGLAVSWLVWHANLRHRAV